MSDSNQQEDVTDILHAIIAEKELSARNMISEQNFLSRPDGSSSFSQGETSVMAAVYGPTEVKQNKSFIDHATVEVILKPSSGLPGIQEKALERMLSNTCQGIILTSFHPRSSVVIVIQIVQDAGSLLSCCLNAACMALMDAGVNMKCLVAAVSCALDTEGEFILDPSRKELKEAKTVMNFAFDNKNSGVMLSDLHGCCSVEEYHACLAACQKASEKVFSFYRTSIEKGLAKT